MLKIFTKLFGSKHDKDIKKIQPTIERINEIFSSLSSLSDDELRLKTASL